MADLYSALSYAETGGETNPWIRTKVIPLEGSSAFGPVQITRGLLQDALKLKVLSPDSAQFAQEVMIPMQDLFLQYGNLPDLPEQYKIYGYGGTGGFDSKQYGEAYKKLANELITVKSRLAMNEQGNVDINKFLKLWRGKEPEPGYRKRFFKKYPQSHYKK